jgi:hypothetical protein
VTRRLFLSATALGLVPAWLASAETLAGETGPNAKPHQTISVEQLQRAVAQRFPLRYSVPGLLHTDLQAPSLGLLPAQNRLSAEMAVQAAGPALNRSHKGTLMVDFALRYEASDQTIRAHQLHIQRLQIPSLQPSVVDMLNLYAPAWAEQSLLEVVLHQLRPQDLAVPDAMGMRPDRITVTGQGVEMEFALKPL